jgi:3-oxoacyl-[acyl-carrier protein] reductase
MNLELAGKAALVSGSSRGIGRGIAEALLAEGTRVMLTGRDEKSLDATRAECERKFGGENVQTFRGDLLNRETIADALAATRDAFGKLDVLVANIGSGRSDNGTSVGWDEWQRMFDVNFRSAVELVEAALPAMIEQGGGSVVLVSSIAGCECLGAPLPYGAAKAAMNFYTHDLARRVADRGVRVNAVAPGNILFPGGSWEEHRRGNAEKVDEYIRTQVPMRRFGTPEEIGAVASFLASPKASFVTGAVVVADGGQVQGV